MSGRSRRGFGSWVSVLALGWLAWSAGAWSALGQAPRDRFDPIGLMRDLDGNRNQVLEPEEIPERGRAAFERLLEKGDFNGDGKLQAGELRALMVMMARGAEGFGSTAELMGMDKDGDGRVARGEYEGPPQLFAILDFDRDGAISGEEAAALDDPRKAAEATARFGLGLVPGGAGGMRPGLGGGLGNMNANPAVLRRLRQMDRDGDGRISREEFLAGPGGARGGAFFDRVDRNGDGFLDRDEAGPLLRRLMEGNAVGGGGANRAPVEEGSEGMEAEGGAGPGSGVRPRAGAGARIRERLMNRAGAGGRAGSGSGSGSKPESESESGTGPGASEGGDGDSGR